MDKITRGIAIVLGLDLLWFIYVRAVLLPPLQKRTHRHKPLGKKNPMDIYKDFLMQMKQVTSYSFKQYLSGFFLQSDIATIHVGNIDSFLAWNIYGSTTDALSPIQSHAITDLRTFISNEFNVLFPPGFHPHSRHVSVDFDNVKHMHRPILFYAIVNTMECYSSITNLYFKGFQRRTLHNTSYWFKPGTSTKPPIVVFHGICSGWGYYTKLIHAIQKNRTVLLFDCPFVKVNWINIHVPDPWTLHASRFWPITTSIKYPSLRIRGERLSPDGSSN
jgi:hypothetical protein